VTYVYFIANAGQSVVKIGVANKPVKRLKTFQTGNHEELIILRVIKVPNRNTAFQLESALHKKFQKYHIRGEWFKLSDTLVEFIENYQSQKLSIIEHSISYLGMIASILGVGLLIVLVLNGYF
jgi:predicted GIY-YIG superfamily endonuclease